MLTGDLKQPLNFTRFSQFWDVRPCHHPHPFIQHGKCIVPPVSKKVRCIAAWGHTQTFSPSGVQADEKCSGWVLFFRNNFVNCTYFSKFLRFAPLGKIQNWILYLWFNCVVHVGEKLQLCYYRVCAVSSLSIDQLSTTWILCLPILIYHPKEWLSTGRTML